VESKKADDVCRGPHLVNSGTKMTWGGGKRTTIIGAFEWTGSRIMQFRKHERNDVDEALLKRFQ